MVPRSVKLAWLWLIVRRILIAANVSSIKKELEVKTVRHAVTIFVISFTLLSCSSKDKETLGFKMEPSFSKTIGRVEADRLTAVIALDDSYSMLSKVNELSSDLEEMFRGLVSTGWDIDLHVVTCAYYQSGREMKSVSTLSLNGNASVEDKVEALMKGAYPTIDLETAQNDADERCNQSLEKAWSNIESNNKVNVSMLISNEDGCSRSDDTLENLDGSVRTNCAPVTHGTIGRDKATVEAPLSVWEEIIDGFMPGFNSWYNSKVLPNLTPVSHYVSFFKNIEVEGKKRVDSFSHIYLPIVVDSNKCLAQALRNQAIRETNKQLEEAGTLDNWSTGSTVGNIGNYYLSTFENLNQENILFNRDEGDLSICGDLSHVVNKLEREIKLRGRSVRINLPRVVDVENTLKIFPDAPVITIVREIELVDSEDFFVRQNQELSKIGLSWEKIDSKRYKLDLYLTSPMIRYNSEDLSYIIENSSLLTVTGGDEVIRGEYLPLGFRDKENGLTYNSN